MDEIGLNSLSEDVPELMSTDPIRSMFESANQRASRKCNIENCSEFLSANIYSSDRPFGLSSMIS